MNKRWLPTRQELLLIPQILLLFMAALVPVMFLFSVIAGLDQYNNHRELLEALQTYGRETEAVITSIDRETSRGYIFLSCPNETDEFDFAAVSTLSLYPLGWIESLAPGQTLPVIFVAAKPHKYALSAVPLAHYVRLQRSSGITHDIWGVFGYFLFIAILKPQFAFSGLVRFEDIFRGNLPWEIP